MGYKDNQLKRHHKLFWGSSYDRGLDILLFMWPDIKAKFSDAELHICYGWNLFDTSMKNNPERMGWKRSVEAMMSQPGIIHHGRIGKEELTKVRKECGIWAYPTYFTEINCITALECQRDGVVPVTMTLAALNETVGSGVKIEGDIKDITVQRQYLEELLKMMEDTSRWQQEQVKAQEFAKSYSWDKIAAQWVEVFKTPVVQPLVSVITPTIREGFWNLMADNLSKQTYQNFEWIIVDDYKEDRSQIAQKYAAKYNLNIRYLRGDKSNLLSDYPRKYGLVRANNLGWKSAQGELLVYLQDFICIPQNGIESLVDIYRHNPNSLIAPVDQMWACTEPNKDNKEDWWDGNTGIFQKMVWRNVRVEFLGLRKTDNPYDFEMNYGAIPKKILDHLNGFWEFMDEGMGYDNTEIATRALKLGYSIIIDDTNICQTVNIGHHGLELNTKGWERLNKGDLPIIRDEKIDQEIKYA